MSIRLGRALARWQRGAGPYWHYVCAAPFLAERMPAPHARSSSDPAPDPFSIPVHWRSANGLAIFLDLPPTPVLRSTAALVECGFVVVPVIQRWPAAAAVLPTSGLLRALVEAAADAAAPSSPRGVMFVLDGERSGPPESMASDPVPVDPSRFDNRYRYTADRFPSPELLRRRGIRAVEWVSERGVEPDLQPYALQLAEADLRPVATAPPLVDHL